MGTVARPDFATQVSPTPQPAERSWAGAPVVLVAGPRCRLCGVLTGVSVWSDGSVHRHDQAELTSGDLCQDCSALVARRRARGLRPPRPDPPLRGARTSAR